MSPNWKKFTVLPAAMLLAGAAAMAQSASSTTSATASTPDPSIAQRKENQQDRIANGVKSGQLTAGETANLETKEAAINGETKGIRQLAIAAAHRAIDRWLEKHLDRNSVSCR